LLLKCSHRANRAWLPSACGPSMIHVEPSGYHQIPPVRTLQLTIEPHLLLSADGFARKDGSRVFCEVMRLYADGTVSRKYHRGDTADEMPSRLTQAIEVLIQASFLRRVTALGGTEQEAASDYTCLSRAFPRPMVHTCPLPSLMERHYHT
jgi:hypothetical protein